MRHACAITQSKVAHRRRIMESIQSYESAMTFAMLRLVDVLLHLREPRIHQSESSSYAFPPARKLSIAAPSDQPSPAGGSALIRNQPIRSTPAGAHPFATRALDPPVTRGLSPLCHPRARPACQRLPGSRPRRSGQSCSHPRYPTLRRSPRLPIPDIRPPSRRPPAGPRGPWASRGPCVLWESAPQPPPSG